MATGSFVAYYRVSTAKQGRSGLGLEAQRKIVETYLNGGSWSIAAEFVEIESGRKSDRHELKRAIAAARAYRVPLIVAKLDRLSRNVGFLSTLRDSGVKVLFADMPEANDLTINLLASVAQWEAETISTRTKQALAAAKARGKQLGGVRAGSGLTTDARVAGNTARQVKAMMRTAEILPIIQEIRTAGVTSHKGIAAELTKRGVPTARGETRWQTTQVRRVLDRIPANREST